MTDAVNALHARVQRVEQSQERDRAEASVTRERVAAQGATMAAQGEDIVEIKRDVAWMRQKLIVLLTISGVASAGLSAFVQWLLQRLH